jgi:hypothetical protein
VLGVGCRVLDLGYDLHDGTLQWPDSKPFAHCTEIFKDPQTDKVSV